jgi:hypothetical protein
MSRERVRSVVWATTAFAYFVAFPEDLSVVIAPAREFLALTDAVSPWLYGAVTACVIAWMTIRCLSRRTDVQGK